MAPVTPTGMGKLWLSLAIISLLLSCAVVAAADQGICKTVCRTDSGGHLICVTRCR